MTDTQTLAPLTLAAFGPGPLYKDINIWLPQLFLETSRAGSPIIENRRFEGCMLEGPAVLLPMSACEFDGCDMGVTNGDVRNLLLAPQGPRQVIGTIAFQNCQFINCRFFAVGFTGTPAFLENMLQVLTPGAAQ